MKQAMTVFLCCLLALACSKAPADTSTNPPTNPPPSEPKKGEFSFIPSGSDCMSVTISGTYMQDVVLSAANKITIPVNVTQTGAWMLATIANGITFSGSGRFAEKGAQSIVLQGSGTPPNGGTWYFTLTANGNTCSFPVSVIYKSITYIVGVGGISLYTTWGDKEPNFYQTSGKGGDVSLSLSRLEAQGDTVIAKLVNADKGTFVTWDASLSYYFGMAFSNVNEYGTGGSMNAVDTAGKLQVWICRKDGQDIVPAGNGKPPIKTIIQVPGKIKDVPGSGEIRMSYPSFNPWHNVDRAFIENLFSGPSWKFEYFDRKQ